MEASQDTQKFIKLATDYLRQRSESLQDELMQHLEVLAGTTNMTCASRFLASLYDLLSVLDHNATLLWPTLVVLRKACETNNDKIALVQTYKFVPVLTRFLDSSLPDEKVQQLLTTLSCLTYGLKVAWQESHLPILIETLAQIVTSNKTILLAPALTTLVNLCYKNMPCVYVLTRKVEIKTFMRKLTAMNSDLSVCVQVCKLFIIFGELKGRLPAEDVLHFVDVTFNYVTEAYRARNSSALRQIVDFFKDVNGDPEFHQIVSRYPKTQQDTKRLLELIEKTDEPDENNLNCIALLFDFIPTVFKMSPQKTIKYLEVLIMKITPWIYNKKTLIPTIKIFLMITEMVEAESLNHTIFDGFPNDFLLDLLNPESVTALESRKDCLPGIADLLTALCITNPAFRHKILQSLECKTFIEDVFDQLYKTNFFYETILSDEHKTNQLCIKLMFFTWTLSAFDAAWKQCYEVLLKREETICSVAVAILNGDKAVKLQAFRLTNTWDQNTMANLIEHLMEKRQSFVTGYNADEPLQMEWVSISSSEQRVKELLRTFDSDQTNTDAIAELYEYKLSAMEQAERQLKVSLSAAEKRCIGLDHQVTQLRGQVARLHQSLFGIQHVAESRTADINDLNKQLENLRNETTQEKKTQHLKLKKLTATIQDLERCVQDQKSDILSRDALNEEQLHKLQEMTMAHESATTECEEIKMRLSDTMLKLEENLKIKLQLENEVEKRGNKIVEMNAKIDECQAQNTQLTNSLALSLEENSQKTGMLAECEQKILHLEHIREAVISVARTEKF